MYMCNGRKDYSLQGYRYSLAQNGSVCYCDITNSRTYATIEQLIGGACSTQCPGGTQGYSNYCGDATYCMIVDNGASSECNKSYRLQTLSQFNNRIYSQNHRNNYVCLGLIFPCKNGIFQIDLSHCILL